MPDRPTSRRPARGRSLDPNGKRALFEAPVQAAEDHLRAGPQREGRDALFSAGPARPGTALVECSACKVRTRVGLADLGVRLMTISAWLPGRRHNHWMRCPSCGRRTWCRIGWND